MKGRSDTIIDLPTRRPHSALELIFDLSAKILILLGERAGARTQDPVIKSHVLYRLSYALALKAAV